jgi:hypothetical protein
MGKWFFLPIAVPNLVELNVGNLSKSAQELKILFLAVALSRFLPSPSTQTFHSYYRRDWLPPLPWRDEGLIHPKYSRVAVLQ